MVDIGIADFWLKLEKLFKHLPSNSYILANVQEIHSTVGLFFMEVIRVEGYGHYYRFEVIDDKKWLIAKLKYGI